ncbi:MAG: type I 3-dehydroquinate dehydratase [Phycisphaerales bacterium]|nr:MAG: type I 3-dehydroquinate dehydratase [Phycisphaerales bacterium]
MTLLVTSLRVDTLTDVERLCARARSGGAEAIELRIDTYRDPPESLAAYLAEHADRTWILTCRAKSEGGGFEGNDGERIALLCKARGRNDTYIDFEWSHWRGLSADLRSSLAGGTGAESRTDLILSTHDSTGVPLHLTQLVEEMLAVRQAAIVKIAFAGQSINDNFPALDLMRQHGRRITATCMGENGLMSRVLAGKLGAAATYCSLSEDLPTAAGQVTLRQMLDLYRFSEISAATKVFGVIGCPVAQSMSPLLFNHWFRRHGVDAVYLPLPVDEHEQTLRSFLDACVKRPWLNVGGFSVTLPHKTAARRWVGTGAGASAARTDAVNTLVFTPDKKTTGYNTDSEAAIDSMTNALGCDRTGLKGLSIDVLGSGGVARAVVAGLQACGSHVTLFGRSADRTRELARAFDAQPRPWIDRAARRGEALIHCTSIGMWPDVDETPMPPVSLAGCRLVFDVVYNPLQTRLMADADAAGATTLGGLDMFVRQAARQLEYWTGVRPDLEEARKLVERNITGKRGDE